MFVLERVDTMNDEVANRLLKTLEEPASYVHLILMTDQLGRVLETVVSRCQLVRFEPLPAATDRGALGGRGRAGRARASRARGCRWATRRERGYLASPDGEQLRADVEALVLAALSGGSPDDPEPWRPLLARAEAQGLAAEEAVAVEAKRRLELEPKGRERKAIEKEFEESAKRDARRARTRVAGAVADADRADVPRPDLPGRGRARRGAGAPTERRRSPSRPEAATRAGCARRPSAAKRCASRWS